jgi:hypothetical protein
MAGSNAILIASYKRQKGPLGLIPEGTFCLPKIDLIHNDFPARS